MHNCNRMNAAVPCQSKLQDCGVNFLDEENNGHSNRNSTLDLSTSTTERLKRLTGPIKLLRSEHKSLKLGFCQIYCIRNVKCFSVLSFSLLFLALDKSEEPHYPCYGRVESGKSVYCHFKFCVLKQEFEVDIKGKELHFNEAKDASVFLIQLCKSFFIILPLLLAPCSHRKCSQLHSAVRLRTKETQQIELKGRNKK